MFCLVVDLYAHPTSRAKFADDAELELGEEGGNEASMRKLLSEEPMAILYCIDGTYVKVTPALLVRCPCHARTLLVPCSCHARVIPATAPAQKTSAGELEGATITMKITDMLRSSYKEHLAKNKAEHIKPKHYTAIEVTSRVGA